jgi:hypothetical protein
MWLATFTNLYSSSCTAFLFSVMHNAFMWVYSQYKAYQSLFLDIILCSVFYQKHFWDWTRLQRQSKSLLRLAQSTKLIPISGHQNQCKAGYINHTQPQLSVGVKFFLASKLHIFLTPSDGVLFGIHTLPHIGSCVQRQGLVLTTGFNQTGF